MRLSSWERRVRAYCSVTRLGNGSSCSCAGGLCGVHGPWASGAPVTQVLGRRAGEPAPWRSPSGSTLDRARECLPRENIFAPRGQRETRLLLGV